MENKQTSPGEWGALGRLVTGPIDSEAKRLKVCLLSVLLLGLLAHGYGFLNFTINHDSLNEFYWSASTPWKISLGRFMEPILRFVMGEKIVLPWMTGLMGLLFAGLAVHLMSKMFRLDEVWENILLSGVCITNVTVTAMVSAYLHDFCGDMLALLLCVLAAWAWSRMKEGFSWKYTILGAVCLGAAFGFYQAYLSVMITLLCIDTILELLQGTRAGKALVRLLRAAPMGLAAVAGYFLCSVLVRRLWGVELVESYNMANMGRSLAGLLDTVGRAYRYAWADLFLPNHAKVLLVSSVQAVTGTMARGVCLMNWILLLGGLAVMAGTVIKKKIRWPEAALIIALVLLLPACMMIVSIASTWLHHLTRYAVWLFYLLVLALLRLGRREFGCRRQQLLAAVMIGMVLFSNVQVANTAYVKKDLERQNTMATMTRVLTRLEQCEGYVYGETPVAIVGSINRGDVPLQVGAVDQLTGLNFNSQITDKVKLQYYFDIVLQYPLNLCSDEEERAITATKEFEAMGCFPEKTAVAVIDGVAVVKMSGESLFF